MLVRSLLLAGALLCAGVGGAAAYETNTPAVQAKFKQIEEIKRSAVDHSDFGGYKSPVVRPANMRDSGHAESMMFVTKTNFRFIDDIGFYVKQLSLSLISNDPSLPVVFDDPTSFHLKPHDGEVVLTPLALSALFNDHVFAFPGAPLRAIKVTTSPGLLTLSGQMFRSKWIPFVMKGGLRLEQGHLLYYKPTTVLVDGQDATKLLPAANVQLDELLKVEAVGVKLIGSTIHLDANKLFPLPKLILDIKEARLEEGGLVLTFGEGLKATVPQTRQNAKSYMIVSGGDVKFMRTMPVNVLLELTATDPNQELDFCLYRYREQIAKGWLTLAPDGSIFGYVKNFNQLAAKGAQQ